MSNAIHQVVVIPASPAQVYAALTDAKTFSAFTGGAPAEIDAKAGGAFSLFGGRVSGRIIDLAPNERIVQAWRPANWDAGLYSLIRFELSPNDSGTQIVFDQHGHSAADQEHLASGWSKMYWEPLKAHFS